MIQEEKKGINRRSIKERSVFLIVIILIFIITIASQKKSESSAMVYITFAINGITWTLLVLKEIRKYPFSINMMQWTFCLFFMFFAGLMQYMLDAFSWARMYSEDTIVKSNIILMLWTIMYSFANKLACNNSYNNVEPKHRGTNKGVLPEWDGYSQILPVLTVLAILILLFRIKNVGISNLFSLGTSRYSYSENSAINTLVGKVLMYSMYFITAFSFYEYKKRKKYLYLIINGSCMLLAYFPTAIPRNNVAGMYFGLLLLVSVRLKKNRGFILLFTAIFMVVFPFLNVFRLAAFSEVDIGESLVFTIQNIPQAWTVADYDAYSLLCGTLEYVNIYGLSWGGQLLAVLFFWVPRSIWHNKPYGSGEMVANGLDWSYSNLSESLPGEGYINFGIIGVVIFAFFFGFIITRLDDFYWRNAQNDLESIHRIDTLYFFMVGYSTFFFRGSLLSTFAYLAATIVAWLILSLNWKQLFAKGRKH